MSAVRADTVFVYVFRREAGRVEFLQLLRANEPERGSWHPVAGKIEPGEAAAAAALREMEEETGLGPGDPALLGFSKLDRPYMFFLAEADAVVIAPCFAVEAAADWRPRLSEEHTDARWIASADIDSAFVWPGQRESCREVLSEIVRPGSLSRAAMRLDPSEA